MANSTVVPALTVEARLKRGLRQHLAALGFHNMHSGMLVPPGAEKAIVRTMHLEQRRTRLQSNRPFIERNTPRLEKVLADGTDVDPSRIRFCLQKISAGTVEADLFRLASLTWSVPVSNGFGRRLRYLVWDVGHGKVAGLIAMGDPVFNLSVRDKLIGWNAAERAERLSNVLDAYVLGALPPYSLLLGGKVVACLVRTKDVYDDFERSYGATRGLISGKQKGARLLLVTTSSSLGRSSVYNRLRLGSQSYFSPIGYTEGWGHFHISDTLFDELRQYLTLLNHPYVKRNRFGQGPNWRLRTIREGLKCLGMPPGILHHGVKRQVFISELAGNSIPLLKSGEGRPELMSLFSADAVAAEAVDRWMLRRARERPDFRTWRRGELLRSLNADALLSSKDGLADAH